MREELLKLNLEELGDEGSREVEDDGSALAAGGLGDLEGGLAAMREEVSLDVEELCAVDERGDLGRLEVRRREHLGGTERRAQRSVVAGDHHGASARLGRRRLHLVCRLNTLGLVRLLERLLQIVVADRPNVRHRALGKDIGSGPSGVLSRTTRNVSHLGVGHNVVVAAR